MAKIIDTIKVEIRPTVSEETAVACLKIVELYMNEHPEKKIVYSDESFDEYRIVYSIKDRHFPYESREFFENEK